MAQQQDLKIVDADSNVSETFADSVMKIGFDSQVWRLEFGVTRIDEQTPVLITGRRYAVCRLVLTPQAGLELLDQLTGVVGQMEKEGIIKRTAAVMSAQTGSKPN